MPSMSWKKMRSETRRIAKYLAIGYFIVFVVLGLLYGLPHSSDAELKTLTVFSVTSKETSTERTPYEIAASYLAIELAGSKRVQSTDLELKVEDTDGSFDTLLKMDTGKQPALGIVQSDVLYHYLNGGHPQFPSPAQDSQIRAVFRFFPEWIHLYHYSTRDAKRQECNSDKVASETGKDAIRCDDFMSYRSAFASVRGSGHYVSAVNLGRLSLADWRDSIVSALPLSGANTPEYHAAGPTTGLAIDVRSPSASSPTFTERGDADVRPLFICRPTAMIMQHAFGNRVYSVVTDNEWQYFKSKTDLSSHLCCWQANGNKNPTTVRVDAVLVATGNVPDPVVDFLLSKIREIDNLKESEAAEPDHLRQLFEKTAVKYPTAVSEHNAAAAPKNNHKTSGVEAAQQQVAASKQNDKDFRTDAVPISLHRRVRFSRIGWTSKWLDELIGIPMLVVLLLLTPPLMTVWWYAQASYRMKPPQPYLNWLRLFWHQHRVPLIFGVCFVVVHFGIAVAVWQSEYHAETLKPETEIATGGISVALKWLCRFVAFGGSVSTDDIRSELSLIWIGMLKGSYWISGIAFTGYLATTFARRLKPMKTKGHVVILGWNQSAHKLTADLFKQHVNMRVVTFTADTQVDADSKVFDHPANQLVRNAETIEAALKSDEAGYSAAKSIIVISDGNATKGRKFRHVDLWVLHVLDEIRRFEQSIDFDHEKAKKPKVIAEIVDPWDVAMARGIRANEVICVAELGMNVISQAAIKPDGFLKILREMLQFSERDNEVYFYRLTAEECQTAGNLRELARLHACSSQESEKVVPCTVIGYRPEGKPESEVVLNPAEDVELREGDEIVVLARKEPDALILLESDSDLPADDANVPNTTREEGVSVKKQYEDFLMM